MTLADLGFILAALAIIGALAGAVWSAVRGRPDAARRRLRRAVIGAMGYLVIVATVGALSPGRTLAMDEDYCADDWCIAVARIVPNRREAYGRHLPGVEPVGELPNGSGSSSPTWSTQPEPGSIPCPPPTNHHSTSFQVRPSSSRRSASFQPETPLCCPAGHHSRRRWQLPGCCTVGSDDSFLHRRAAVRPRRIVTSGLPRRVSAFRNGKSRRERQGVGFSVSCSNLIAKPESARSSTAA
ncbi:MAG: hypothetical protein R2882_10915 [Gemmatimonadales bacterium]